MNWFEVVDAGEICGTPVLPGDHVAWHVEAHGPVVSILRHRAHDHGRLLGALAAGLIRPIDGDAPVAPLGSTTTAARPPAPTASRGTPLQLVK